MSETTQIDVLLKPISETLPSGSEANNSPEYESIREEIDKLTNPQGDGQVDWQLVGDLAQNVLEKLSKDYLVTAWLAVAWTQTRGIAGFYDGVELLRGMLEQFWQNGYPELKRLRGRRNALQWWQDKCVEWFNVALIPAVQKSMFDTLLSNLNQIDSTLSDLDPECPPFRELLGLVQRLDTISDPIPAPDPSPEEVLSPDENGTVKAPSIQESLPESSEPDSDSAALSSNAKQLEKGPAIPLTTTGPLGDPELRSIDDIPRALSPVSAYLDQMAASIKQIDPYNPLFIKLSRFAARASILALPPAQGARTRIPAPNTLAFEAVIDAKNPAGIVDFCESRLNENPFWLDLEMQAANAYASIGKPTLGLRQAQIDEVLGFIDRLPGVEQLQFDDGTPFASAKTKTWIEACRLQRGGTGTTDLFESTRRSAMELSGNGEIAGAMTVYQDFISNTRSKRDQFRARLALVTLLIESKERVDVMPFLKPLLDEVELRALSEWEPEMALDVWSHKLRAVHDDLDQARQENDVARIDQAKKELDEALKQVALLNFVVAADFV